MDAIIPGYGFLSENSDFARAVAAAGMVFAGPSPESIEAFGLKHTARDLATKAGVPIVPGSQGLVTSEDEAVTISKNLGFPVGYPSQQMCIKGANPAIGYAKSYSWWRWNGSANVQH